MATIAPQIQEFRPRTGGLGFGRLDDVGVPPVEVAHDGNVQEAQQTVQIVEAALTSTHE
jgi:hypothetical protein